VGGFKEGRNRWAGIEEIEARSIGGEKRREDLFEYWPCEWQGWKEALEGKE